MNGRRDLNKKSGSALVYAVIIIMVVTMISMTVGTISVMGYRNSVTFAMRNEAKLIAESGIDKGMYYLNNSAESIIPDIDPDDPLVTGFKQDLGDVESKVKVQRDSTDASNKTYIITSMAYNTVTKYEKQVRVKVRKGPSPLAYKLANNALTMVSQWALQVPSNKIEIYGDAYIKADSLSFGQTPYVMHNGNITFEAPNGITLNNKGDLNISGANQIASTDTINNEGLVVIDNQDNIAETRIIHPTNLKFSLQTLNLNPSGVTKRSLELSPGNFTSPIYIYDRRVNGQAIIFYTYPEDLNFTVPTDRSEKSPDAVFDAYIRDNLSDLDSKKIFKVVIADRVNINDTSTRYNYIIYSNNNILTANLNNNQVSTFINSNIYGGAVVNNGLTVYGLNIPESLASGYEAMNDELKEILYEHVGNTTQPSGGNGAGNDQFEIVEYN